MALDLVNYKQRVEDAVKLFWQTRVTSGSGDNRADVVQGKHLDGFIELIKEITIANGLSEDCVNNHGGKLVLPGFFRATKDWDTIVVYEGKLIAAFEFKSQVGPSFGNNFNNRLEESLGSATDLWTAYRENAFGVTNRPFLGYLTLIEDCKESRKPVRVSEPHFDVFPEFKAASYIDRYQLLCKKLMTERLYDATTLLLSERTSGINGEYSDYYLHAFVSGYAAHIAAITSS